MVVLPAVVSLCAQEDEEEEEEELHEISKSLFLFSSSPLSSLSGALKKEEVRLSQGFLALLP